MRGHQGDHDGGRYDAGDHEQGGQDGDLQAEALCHEFRPEEDKDRGQAVVQICEAVFQPFQHEVQRPQPQDSEDDRGVGYEVGLVTGSTAGTESMAKMSFEYFGCTSLTPHILQQSPNCLEGSLLGTWACSHVTLRRHQVISISRFSPVRLDSRLHESRSSGSLSL
jgi:hypothetical protein